ncbi:MAG: GIY-YIG nuclease family protein [Candidatus Poribacteria bacterium]|nr:GIY-YIG nuclease family protein [Candidatus Poribacteria bacterium]
MKNPGIYILTSPSGKQYVGKDSNLPRRVREHLRGDTPECRLIHKAVQKYGRDAFSVEIIQYPGISHEALNAMERWKIRQLQTLVPAGYNLTEGGDGCKQSEYARQSISKAQSQRVADGTHIFLDEDFRRHSMQKQLEDGTHPFSGGEIQRRTNQKRVRDGTHHFLGGEIARRSAQKRIADGTHNFIGGDIPRRTQRRLVENGTHHFLNGEVSRQSNKKRVEDGTHHFLGDKNPVHKRIKDGTHHFLGDSNPSHARVKDGTHHLLGNNHWKRKKRQKAEWCYIIALSRFWYEIHDYTLKRRAEFLSKDIPDTSNAEQEYLF